MKVTGYFRCSCGATTIVCDDGAEYSCLNRNVKAFFPGLDLRKVKRYKTTRFCNHCVNHYGLDLCGCGSGEFFGSCPNGHVECGIPMQRVGQYTHVIASDVIARMIGGTAA